MRLRMMGCIAWREYVMDSEECCWSERRLIGFDKGRLMVFPANINENSMRTITAGNTVSTLAITCACYQCRVLIPWNMYMH